MIERGVICMAQNNSTTNYLRLAYLQRLSLKLVAPDLPYAVVTDQASLDTLNDKQRQAFDHIIILALDQAKDQDWKQKNDWQLFTLSPFRENIKVESDLLFTRNIDHWWPMLRHRDLVLSLGCKDMQGCANQSRRYRAVFDANGLPDTYSGLMYWRRSVTASTFFNYCKRIYQQWDTVQQSLVRCEDPGSNDLVFSIAARIVGEELVTLPTATFFNIVHMKPAVNNQLDNWTWYKNLTYELAPPSIRLSAQEQLYPFHYHYKEWATNEVIEQYESATRSIQHSLGAVRKRTTRIRVNATCYTSTVLR